MKLLAEAARSVFAQPVGSAITGLIVAGVCAAILSTTGQTVRAEDQVLSRIDAAGTRSIVVLDTRGTAGLTAEAVDRISRISGVEWAIGVGVAVDVRSAGNLGGSPAPLWVIAGALPPEIETTGSGLVAGHALIGPGAKLTLGFQSPIGGVVGQHHFAVVGAFTAADPLQFLNSGLISRAAADDKPVRQIHVLVEKPAEVSRIAEAARLLIAPEDPTSVAVQTSETLGDVRAAIEGELGRFGRELISLVLSAGLILTGLNVYGSVSTRRRDFGRRRALGASRATVVGIVAAQTAIAAVVGASVGVTATLVVLRWTTTHAPGPRFAAASAILASLAAIVASLIPAFVAAYRDPVRVLRVP